MLHSALKSALLAPKKTTSSSINSIDCNVRSLSSSKEVHVNFFDSVFPVCSSLCANLLSLFNALIVFDSHSLTHWFDCCSARSGCSRLARRATSLSIDLHCPEFFRPKPILKLDRLVLTLRLLLAVETAQPILPSVFLLFLPIHFPIHQTSNPSSLCRLPHD